MVQLGYADSTAGSRLRLRYCAGIDKVGANNYM